MESELEQGGYVASGMLTTGTKPFNVFARLVAGAMAQPEMAAANALLDGPAAERFLLACKLKENDEHPHSSAPEWLGKAAMSQRHRFLLRDLDWSWFNALVFGMRDGAQLAEAVATLEAMREAALATRAPTAAGRRRSASTSTATRSTRCRRSTCTSSTSPPSAPATSTSRTRTYPRRRPLPPPVELIRATRRGLGGAAAA